MKKFIPQKFMFFIVKEQRKLLEGFKSTSRESLKGISASRSNSQIKFSSTTPDDFTLYYCTYSTDHFIKGQTVCTLRESIFVAESIFNIFNTSSTVFVNPDPEIMVDCKVAVEDFERKYLKIKESVISKEKTDTKYEDNQYAIMGNSGIDLSLDITEIISSAKSGKNINF